jgi:hypothetical protein
VDKTPLVRDHRAAAFLLETFPRKSREHPQVGLQEAFVAQASLVFADLHRAAGCQAGPTASNQALTPGFL